MAQKLTVVVAGSTGKQGGAVARGLLERGHKVRAVTRDPNSSQAKLLANAGATLVAASLEDTVAITKALKGATSFFAMTMPSGGTDAEIRQGIAAADPAKAAGVHLVFTCVGSANRQTGIPHFDSKYEVEKHIAKSASAQRFWRRWPSWRTSISRKSSSLRDLRDGASGDKGARASCRRGHWRGRRSRLRGCRSLHGQALRPRERRAHGE